MMYSQSTTLDYDNIESGYLGPTPAHIGASREDADLLLDLVHASLLDGHDHRTLLNVLNSGLKMARSYMAPSVWNDFCSRSQHHPLICLLKEDPFIHRVNEKPRGYAGDAVMIDMIYGTGDCNAIVGAATAFGQTMYATTSASAASVGVRERRSILAERIDAVADSIEMPTILAIAAGHLREAMLSSAFREGRIGRFVALDQDLDSIAEITASLGTAIEPVPQAINVVLKGEYCLESVDYAYAAGLYDYLPHGVAVRLTRKLAAMLRPGGKLLFANFADDIWDVGFMEAVMDWKLILRSRGEMAKIADAIGDGFSAIHWTGSNGAIHYCELTRR